MDKYEVTQAEYEKVMGNNPSIFKGSNLPVDGVAWDEANDYCQKAGKRLPTEWEFAARGIPYTPRAIMGTTPSLMPGMPEIRVAGHTL